jgi:ABC-type uncharacterized transport system involved in gliding motility auxiliary subunit
MTLFPLTRSVEPAKAPPKGINVQALARTSAQSWGETDRVALQRGEAKPDPQDRKGPLAVATVATIDPPATPPKDAGAGGKAEGKADAIGKAEGPEEEKKPTKARVVVLGTASIASNYYLGAQGNRDFFLNVISWLAEEEGLLSIRAKDNKAAPIILTGSQSQLVFWLPVVVLPGALVASGILVMARRRRAR